MEYQLFYARCFRAAFEITTANFRFQQPIAGARGQWRVNPHLIGVAQVGAIGDG
jgi:hypothetical protein